MGFDIDQQQPPQRLPFFLAEQETCEKPVTARTHNYSSEILDRQNDEIQHHNFVQEPPARIHHSKGSELYNRTRLVMHSYDREPSADESLDERIRGNVVSRTGVRPVRRPLHHYHHNTRDYRSDSYENEEPRLHRSHTAFRHSRSRSLESDRFCNNRYRNFRSRPLSSPPLRTKHHASPMNHQRSTHLRDEERLSRRTRKTPTGITYYNRRPTRAESYEGFGRRPRASRREPMRRKASPMDFERPRRDEPIRYHQPVREGHRRRRSFSSSADLRRSFYRQNVDHGSWRSEFIMKTRPGITRQNTNLSSDSRIPYF